MNNLLRILFFGLSGKMRLVVGICFLLTLVVLGIFIYSNVEQSLITLNNAKLENITKLIYQMTELYVQSSIKNYLTGMAEKTRELAEFYAKKAREGEISETEAKSLFASLILDPQYGKIGETGYIATLNSKGIATIHPKEEIVGQNLTVLEVMQKVIIMKNGYIRYWWQNPGESVPREKAAALSYFAPWDMIIWITTYNSDASRLIDIQELEKKLTQLKIGANGYAFIMDKSGTLLIHPDSRLKGKNIYNNTDATQRKYMAEICHSLTAAENPVAAGTETAGDVTLPLHGAIINREETTVYRIETVYYPGEDPAEKNPRARMAAYTYYPEMGWILFASSTVMDMYSDIDTIKTTSIWIVLIAFLISNAVIALVIQLILRPVADMKKIVSRISHGDLSNRLEVVSNDEIGQMSDQFNTLLDNFENILKRIKTSSTALLDSVHGLSVSSQEISSTSNEQAAAVKEIVSTMEDSDTLAKSIADKINDVAQIAGKMKETVADGFSIIKNSLAKMDEIKTSNSGTIVGVQALSDKIRSIWEIVNIINGIADQTKIIAFNAELEASAAGDAGRNFQIVATEIRRLADNTVASTDEIKAKINEIQYSSDNLIISSEEGTTRIKEGWNLSNELQQVFNDILHSSEISANSAEQIALSINQQVSAFEQILLTLRQISEGIDNFVDSTKTTTTESQKLKEMADGLNAAIDQYATNTEKGGHEE